ncbi:PIH1 domain-containing protein Nop17-like [Oratosquilla oratoria]|uniref:PIH1 domain-containing protein Nop17-like n=1 Tax=Oratosquilla oratoria TaxID=337810 RepID=UPI003F763D87
MAAEKTSAPEFFVSRDELSSLDKALKDEKFRTLLTEFVEEISDPEKKRLHEEEVKKLEKEKGVEVEFILPTAGFVLELRETAGKDEKAKRTAVNLCSSDKVAPPSCEPVINGKSRGLNWVIPHTISPARTEVVKCEKNPSTDAVIIYDVVFHPDTVHLAMRNIRLRKLLIDTALEAVNKNHRQNIKFEEISQVREGEYFGKEFTCTVKRIVDEEKYQKWKQGELPLHVNGSESTGISQVSQDIHNEELESDTIVQKTELGAPAHRIKYQTNMDIQDFCVPLNGVGVSTRPTALVVEVDLPGVERASEVDVDICPQFLNLKTPKHKLDLKLPYPVDEDSSSAKFDVATCMLTLNLTVIPNNNNHKPVVHSQLSDSGIECESGYRTSSDGDNSSDVSCSSLEERLVEEVELNDEDPLHSVSDGTDAVNPGDEKKSGETLVSKVHSYLQPPFTIAQRNSTLNINIKCHNVVPGSVTVNVIDEKSLQISYTNIGSGRTPLNYGLHVVMPEACSSEIRHSLSEKDAHLVVEIEKLTAEKWESCVVEGKTVTIPPPSELYSACEEIPQTTFSYQVQKVDGEEPKCEEKEVILQHHAVEANVIVRNDKDLQKPSNPKEISQVIPTVAAVRAAFVKARTVSECVDVPYDDTSSDNRRGPTGSWPRGILKRRPRSLSESHVGCMGSVGSFGSYSSSFDLEGLEDEVLEKEEEEEEGNESSSPGSKKTVRFSEVVSKQLFRSNSSILGQRAKNQRKALKKRRAQERKLSESDQEITGSKKSDDEDDDEDEGVGAEEEIVQEMKEIDLEGDIFDSTTCEEETTDTDNNNTQSDNNSKNNITNKELAPNKKKNKKKGKKNKNKIKSLELSNAMIFELDIEQ